MDEESKKVVDISLARIQRGEIEEKLRKQVRINKLKRIGIFGVIFMALCVFVYFYDSDVYEANFLAQEPESSVIENGIVQVVLKQDERGHYVFAGEINGKRVKFLLDTGATSISVPIPVARYLNLPIGESYYSNTANGRSLSYGSIAREVRVGMISLFDIEASIASGMEGDEILLGMSFLKNISIKQESGKMYLSQKLIVPKL